jgi:hypothetical protein
MQNQLTTINLIKKHKTIEHASWWPYIELSLNCKSEDILKFYGTN